MTRSGRRCARVGSALVLAGMAAASGAAPAGAHAIFQGVKTVPVDSDGKLTMFVPHERDEATYNVEVVIALAAGWKAVDCAQKPTWTCTLGQSGSSPVITFTKDSAAQRSEDETFEFTVHSPPTVGQFSFPTRQSYSDGGSVNWTGAPGSAEPAPILKTLTGDQGAAAGADSGAASVAPLDGIVIPAGSPSVSATPVAAPVVEPVVEPVAQSTEPAGSTVSTVLAAVLAGLVLFGVVSVRKLRRDHVRGGS